MLSVSRLYEVRFERERNVVMGPAGLETKNDCAGEAQKQIA
jgi:hypothetical protein